MNSRADAVLEHNALIWATMGHSSKTAQRFLNLNNPKLLLLLLLLLNKSALNTTQRHQRDFSNNH